MQNALWSELLRIRAPKPLQQTRSQNSPRPASPTAPAQRGQIERQHSVCQAVSCCLDTWGSACCTPGTNHLSNNSTVVPSPLTRTRVQPRQASRLGPYCQITSPCVAHSQEQPRGIAANDHRFHEQQQLAPPVSGTALGKPDVQGPAHTNNCTPCLLLNLGGFSSKNLTEEWEDIPALRPRLSRMPDSFDSFNEPPGQAAMRMWLDWDIPSNEIDSTLDPVSSLLTDQAATGGPHRTSSARYPRPPKLSSTPPTAMHATIGASPLPHLRTDLTPPLADAAPTCDAVPAVAPEINAPVCVPLSRPAACFLDSPRPDIFTRMPPTPRATAPAIPAPPPQPAFLLERLVATPSTTYGSTLRGGTQTTVRVQEPPINLPAWPEIKAVHLNYQLPSLKLHKLPSAIDGQQQKKQSTSSDDMPCLSTCTHVAGSMQFLQLSSTTPEQSEVSSYATNQAAWQGFALGFPG